MLDVGELLREIQEMREGGYLSDAILRERSEEHTSELQSRGHLVCRLLHEKNELGQVPAGRRTRAHTATGRGFIVSAKPDTKMSRLNTHLPTNAHPRLTCTRDHHDADSILA